MPPPIITLLTDFGTSDTFSGVMKGVILGINPKAKIVDLTHEIRPFHIESAAYVLFQASRHFPKGSIHVAVVDPGVGGKRKPIVVQTKQAYFVGPDNGIFSYIYDAEPKAKIYQVMAKKYRLKDYSPTFEGRDVFSPVAAWLSKGTQPAKMGVRIINPMFFDISRSVVRENGNITGKIIHIDGFGNLITNITKKDLRPWLGNGKEITIRLGGEEIKGLSQYYQEGSSGSLSALVNSDDQLEIFVVRGSAKDLSGAGVGEGVEVV
ncbi:MAG TPA: SAM-dependent chlorinase/fluorinase [Nitrospiria bacterium]